MTSDPINYHGGYGYAVLTIINGSNMLLIKLALETLEWFQEKISGKVSLNHPRKKKKTKPLFMDRGQLFQDFSATTRRQFNFNLFTHNVEKWPNML